MKYFLIVCLQVFLISLNLNAQGPTCAWAKGAGGTGKDYCLSSCADANGNVYITGYFTGPTLVLGSITLVNTTPGGNMEDFFIAKYDASGNVLWARGAPGINYDAGNSITVDNAGNIIVFGEFASPVITFGSITLGLPLPTNTARDIFIVKYDPAGNVIWARREGGNSYENAGTVCADQNNNIFIVGTFASDTMSVGTTTFVNTINTWNSLDMFIAKYDAAGNPLWARNFGDTSRVDIGFACCADPAGNFYFSGIFMSATISFGNNTLYNTGALDSFITKIDASGNIVWCRQIGTPKDDHCTGLAADASGNVFATGFFYSASIAFGYTTLINNITAGDVSDAFVVKYNVVGNVVWAKSITGQYDELGEDVLVDSSGDIIVVGSFNSPTVTAGAQTLTNTGSADVFPKADVFIVKYDSGGNVLWSVKAGGTDHDFALAVSNDTGGNIWVSGYFFSPFLNVGNTTINNTTTGGPDNIDVFVAKFSGATAGFEERSNASVVSLFPNPFRSECVLHTEQKFENANLTIVNALGEIIRQINNISGQSMVLKRDELPPGSYVILVEDQGRAILTKKIVICDQ
jgi:hypothetical protein